LKITAFLIKEGNNVVINVHILYNCIKFWREMSLSSKLISGRVIVMFSAIIFNFFSFMSFNIFSLTSLSIIFVLLPVIESFLEIIFFSFLSHLFLYFLLMIVFIF
jgi:hypothetical protein